MVILKICIDLTSVYDKLSGIEKYALNITKNMVLNDKENIYILIFKNEVHIDFKFVEKQKNINIKIINGMNKLYFSQIKLLIELYKIKCDYFLFLAFQAPILFFKKNQINTVHDMTPWLFANTMSLKGLLYFKLSIALAMRRSVHIITISESSKRDINKYFNNKNISVIYCGVDPLYQKQIDDIKLISVLSKYNINEKGYFLCLATLEPRKNFPLLLNAYVELRKELKTDKKLVIVGRKGWKFEDIFKILVDNKLESEVQFTGFVEEQELPYIYIGAECFVFPSIYEGFGMPPLEAMASGVPVIVSDSSSLPEVVGENGITFLNNNNNSLKSKIEQVLLMDSVEKDKLIIYELARSKKFNWKVEGKKLIGVLENLE